LLTLSGGDEEIQNVDVRRALAASSFSVLLEENGTLVVLKQNIVSDFVTLGLHEIPSPADRWHEVIISTNDLGLRRAPSIEFLLVELTMGNPCPKDSSPPECHVPRRTPDYGHFFLVNSIGDEEIQNVDVCRALAASSFSVLLEENGTLVVLKQNIVSDFVTLCLHEIPSPADRWHEVISTNDLGLRRAPSIEFLLVELTMGNPRPKDSPPPECPRMLGCTANDASTHHFRMPLPLALRISGII
jgi:hypothetical protein